MGESTNSRAKLRFDRRIRLEFHGATITSDAGLLACRELDDALGLTETTNECLQESRGGRNVQHRLVGLLRQSVYSRLAGLRAPQSAREAAMRATHIAIELSPFKRSQGRCMGRVDGYSWRRLSRVGDGNGRVLEERRADVKALAGASCAIRGRGRGRDGTGGPGKLGVATQ